MSDDAEDDVRDPSLVALLDERRAWQRLIESSEWGKLIKLLQGQVDGLQSQLLSPAPSMELQMLGEYRKGQLEGRLSVSNTVETVLSELTEEIERKRNG